MNTDKSGEGRILSLSTLGEPMSEEEFEDKMNTYELDQQYAEYIMEHRNVGNGEMLIRIILATFVMRLQFTNWLFYLIWKALMQCSSTNNLLKANV